MHWVIFFGLAMVIALTGCDDDGTSPPDGTVGEDGGGCIAGSERCECSMGSCFSPLVCRSNLCVDPGTPDAEPGTDAGLDGGDGGCPLETCAPPFACTEQGVRDAIAEGGGPHRFECDGPTTVVTESEIVIHDDVVLDGEGELVLDAELRHTVLSVQAGFTVELRGFTVRGGNGAEGGGIRNDGTLSLMNSTVSGCTAHVGGGIHNGGSLALRNVSVSGNTSATDGGGLFNRGTLTITGSTVSGNRAADEGGGLHIDQGEAAVTNSLLSDNRATVGAGLANLGASVALTNTEVSGNTSSGGGGGVVNFRNTATMTLIGCLVSDNASGGIVNQAAMTLTNSTVSDNTGREDGGGIHSAGDATLAVVNSSITGNRTTGYGGGLANLGGALTLTSSTVSGNEAAEYGGGIASIGTTSLVNSTISGNAAVVSGGGIFHAGLEDEARVASCTIAGNTAGDGTAVHANGLIAFANSLLVGDCVSDPSPIVFSSLGANIESPGSTCGLVMASDRPDVADPNIGPLQDNGGPTETHALLSGSVAIDHTSSCRSIVDQRGLPRPGGDGCDVGAFEVQP